MRPRGAYRVHVGQPRKPAEQRDASPTGTVALHMRWPVELVQAVDAWVDELRAAGGIGASGVTRTVLVRDLVARAVSERNTKG